MIILNGLLSFLAVVSSWHIEKRIKFYMAMILVLEFGVMGVFAAFDLFLFFLFWEVELIPMFLLIGIWGGARREYAAWKFLIYTFTASAVTLAGIFLLYFQTGGSAARSRCLAGRAEQGRRHATVLRARSRPAGDLPALFVAFAVKLPMAGAYLAADAHRGADGGERPLAGVLLKMGAYG
jgi:NADH-quinone oxidoreductase subunit M